MKTTGPGRIDSRRKSFFSRGAWLLLLGAGSLLGTETPEEDRPNEVEDVIEKPDPDNVDKLPGGFLTILIEWPEEVRAKSVLPEDAALAKAFRERAAERWEELESKEIKLTVLAEKDETLRELWDEALEKILVVRSRPRPDGTFVVVCQADLLKLLKRLDETRGAGLNR